jgi:hypothetical protein
VAAGFGALSASYGRPAALWVSPEALTAFAVAGLFVTAIIVTSVSVFGLGPGLAVGLTITMLAARANGGWAGDGSGPADLMAPSRAAGGAVQHAIESSVQAAGWPVTVLAALAASGAVVVLGAAAATRAARRREF